MKRKRGIVFLLILAVLTITGCSNVTTVNESRQDVYTYDEAVKELEVLSASIETSTTTSPVLDIYSDEPSVSDALADIDTFPLTVKGTAQINLEIAGATELTSDTPDDWLNIVAANFNREHFELDGKTVSVSVRQITSGETVNYIKDGNYRPQVFIPSNNIWGKMLDASGIKTEILRERILGNTAGILIKQDTYDGFIEKYKEPSMNNILEAALNGDLLFAYTNPYTSSTGINILCEMLSAFDPNDPLSEKASNALMEYQKQSPPVAYTTAVLKNSAAKGIINAMVMEEQAYINTPELRNYVYIPSGLRHDHPVYAFDWTTDVEKQAAQLFIDYCLEKTNQSLGSEKGFNRNESYVSSDQNMTGTDYLTAQKIWKQNKNGGKPVIAVFVADVSMSMNGEPLNSLKSSLVSASSYIGSEHYIGLVSYSSGVNINLPIAQFDPAQRAYFSGEVKALSVGSNTATYDAVLVALQMIQDKLKEIPDAKPMLFVLTDGDQNTGYSLHKTLPVVGGLQVPVYSIAYNYKNTAELDSLSEINEASVIKADTDDVVNQLRNLFNVNL